VDHIVAAGNALKPDLIAITGDLVDGGADGTRAKAERLGALQATHGVCFVTGNHEYYAGVARWLRLFQELGWRVLDNKHVLLEHRGARLAVAGMPDPTAGSVHGPDLARALAGIPADAFRLLLFHPPTGAEAAERAGVGLQLSGHTHAGQYFPWSLVVPALYAHPKGLGRSGRMWIYTSVGTGFWGPPNRFLVPPELTLIELYLGFAERLQ
jgi:predicted MPP superfamily phosphohydrolase